MFLFSRSFRRRGPFQQRTFLLIILAFLCCDTFLTIRDLPPPRRQTELPASLSSQTIYIASIHRNTEYALRLYWGQALLDLVIALGPSKVYISIIESGSQDGTKTALLELVGELGKLGVGINIELGSDVWGQMAELEAVPESEDQRAGWIYTGRGESGWEVRRIPYLSNLRNQAMGPLYKEELWDENQSGWKSGKFDKILWLNDVAFNTEDVMTLLGTRQGSYAAACSMDFSKHADQYYDTFALRDAQGHKTSQLTWPYFHSSQSLRALYAGEPIPVKSCWNGMIVFDSAPFYGPRPLRYRGVSDMLAREHIEGSECCLIHSDNHVLRDSKGVWLNPNVRVSYNASTYALVNPLEEQGRWPGQWQAVKGIWTNRFAFLDTLRQLSERNTIKRRVDKIAKKYGAKKEEGMECLVNEMQVLYKNGWMHV